MTGLYNADMELLEKHQDNFSTRNLYFLPNIRSFRRKTPRPAYNPNTIPHNHTTIEHILARKIENSE